MDDLFARLSRGTFSGIDPNATVHEMPIGGANIQPAGWYGQHDFSSSIAQINVLQDPTLETLSRLGATVGTSNTSLGYAWNGKYVLNSGSAPSVRSISPGAYRGNFAVGNANGLIGEFLVGASGDGAANVDVYIFPAAGFSPRNSYLDWLVGTCRIITDRAVPSDVASATVTLEIYNSTDSTVDASSAAALDLTTLTAGQPYPLKAALTKSSSVFATKTYLWRLKFSTSWAGTLDANGGPRFFFAEPSLRFSYSPDQTPYSPPISLWRPPETPQLLGSNESLLAASTITPPDWATLCLINAAADRTMTSTPTISAGRDGQEMVLLNIGSHTVTIQDHGTLASSALYLTANTVAIGPRDSVRLAYSTDVGGWVQIGNLVSVL